MTSRTAVFDYAGFGMLVEAPAADLIWLRECLGPDFAEQSDLEHVRRPDREIVLSADSDAFSQLLDRGPDASGCSMGCYVLDRLVESLPRWNSPDQAVVVFDPGRLTFCRRPSRRRIELVTRPGNLTSRVALLRAVRETAANHVRTRRAVVVHGAAFAWDGRGCVIAGSKMAGKTTLLLYLLAQGAGFIANDRTVVWRDAEPLTLRGMPTIVNVRAPSLQWFPALEQALVNHRYHHRYSLDESAHHGIARAAHGRDWSLTPAQLVRLLGVSRITDVPLTTVLFPRRDESQRGIRVEPLAKDVAAERLMGALLARESRNLVAEFFRDPSTEFTIEALDVERLVERVRSYECTLGADAYQDDGPARLLVELTRR